MEQIVGCLVVTLDRDGLQNTKVIKLAQRYSCSCQDKDFKLLTLMKFRSALCKIIQQRKGAYLVGEQIQCTHFHFAKICEMVNSVTS